MNIPPLLKNLINSDHDIAGIINGAIANFTPWISNSSIPLFPEYTDHSLKHVEEVIQTAEDLISDEARDLISKTDAAVLVLAICLHDCAMHLTEDGFRSLISPNSRWRAITHFPSPPWSELWEDFLSEAFRFDGRKLTALFGDSDPVRTPPQDKTKLTMRDRMLMGEFIRRHHTRLAHEIALYGIPGPNGTAVNLIDKDSELARTIADLSGVIARSHGLNLRETLPFLEDRYHIRDFHKIHAVYLMTLVRIADYLQIQSQRAPKPVLRVRSLASPISQGEWKVHESIRNISPAGNDPEAIDVIANPENVNAYLRLKEWLAGIQSELDVSWAVLGEVYGRFSKEKLDLLKIKLRRIRSNIDDTKKFSETTSFVPARIAFEAANPDLLKLLVGPLYTDDATVGIRELLQNSIDAVRELKKAQETRSDLILDQQQTLPSDVVLSVACNKEGQPISITVSDKGTGMNAEIIQNYFLKAGASFRKSDAWKKEFETKDGKSKVLRSGRFGVGALAAFLIGEKITVRTRHYESPPGKGIQFSAGIDDESLSLEWCDAPVGTEIKVDIPEFRRNQIAEQLHIWSLLRGKDDRIDFGEGLGWYFAETPAVTRIIKEEDQPDLQVEVHSYLPSEEDNWKWPWRSFKTPDFSKIFWTFNSNEGNTYNEFPGLACNGIMISKSEPSLLESDHLETPKLCVYDRDGKLPLNLQRTELASKNVSFTHVLERSVTHDLIAHALVCGPTEKQWGEEEARFLKGIHKGVDYGWREKRGNAQRWFFSRSGFGFADINLVANACPRALIYIYTSLDSPYSAKIANAFRKIIPADVGCLLINDIRIDQLMRQKFITRGLLDKPNSYYDMTPQFLSNIYENENRTIYLRAEIPRNIIKPRKTPLGESLRFLIDDAMAPHNIRGDWIVKHTGEDPPKDITEINNSLKTLPNEVVAMRIVKPLGEKPEEASSLSKYWLDLLKSAAIPYHQEGRANLLNKHRKTLSQYVELWNREVAELARSEEET